MSAEVAIAIFVASLLLVILDLTPKSISKKYKQNIFDAFCIILIVFASSKNADMCFDTSNYADFYISSPSLYSLETYDRGFELGWDFLCRLFHTIGFSYHFFFFFVATSSILIYRYVILKRCKHIFIALFTYVSCFYFLNEIIILRHGLASSLVFLELHFLAENKRKLAVICMLLAFSIHTVGIFGLIPIFIKNDNITVRYFFIIPIAFIVNDAIVIKMLNLAGLSSYLTKIDNYTTNEQTRNGIRTFVLYLLPLVLTYIVFLKKTASDSYVRECSLFMILSAYFQLSFTLIESFGRCFSLFLVSNISLSSYYLDYFKHGKQKYLFICFIIINAYIFLRQNFYNSSGMSVYK